MLRYLLLLAVIQAPGLQSPNRPIPQSPNRPIPQSPNRPIAQSTDSTTVILLGTGVPIPDPQAQGPATAVTVGQRIFLFDAGPGVEPNRRNNSN